MSKTTKNLALSILAASAFVSAPAFAELSGNVGATSNYIWRGVTQNGDNAAVQGGIDYTHESGFYAGTWTSSLGDANVGTAYEGYELDLYAGYKFKAGSVALDVGAISYMYPLDTHDDTGAKVGGISDSFEEIYLGASMDAFSAKISYGPDVDLSNADNTGIYVEAAYGLGPVSFHVGNYSFDEAINADGDKSYMDYSIAVAKDEFSFGVSNTDLGGYDDPRVFVTYKKGFGL
jgi:uncharacterized protein (TIGR02001 family)